MVKYTKKGTKYWGLYIKWLISRWFYGDNNIFLGTLFLKSCLHGLQKLNFYNHVFELLASTWIGPKICVS